MTITSPVITTQVRDDDEVLEPFNQQTAVKPQVKRYDEVMEPYRPPSPPQVTARCEFPQLNRLLHRDSRLTARARRQQAGRPRMTQECPIHAPQMTKAL